MSVWWLLLILLQAQFPLGHMHPVWKVVEEKVVENSLAAVLYDSLLDSCSVSCSSSLPSQLLTSEARACGADWTGLYAPQRRLWKSMYFLVCPIAGLKTTHTYTHTHTHTHTTHIHTFTGIWQWCWDSDQRDDDHTGRWWIGQGTEAVPCGHVQQESYRAREEKTVSMWHPTREPVWPSLVYK